MQFILIAIGMVLVFIALKLNKNEKKELVAEKFDELLENKLKDESDVKLNFIIDQIKELNLRFDNIEDSILLLSGKLDEIQNGKIKNDIKQEVIDIKSNNNTIEKEEEIEELSDINDIIFNMKESGFSLDEISSKLNIGKGEVLLRLGLKKAKI